MPAHGVDRTGAAGGSGTNDTPIAETLVTAKGDLIVGSANAEVDNLAVGTNDYLLVADSAQTLGMKWASGDTAFQSMVTTATAETAPAVGDIIMISDVSQVPDAGRSMTLENMLKVVNGLTEDTTPDTDDFLLSYDVSASGVKKVKPENLPLAARKNAIINGDFSVWQRGTSFAAAVAGSYTADRWRYNVSGAAVHTASRSTTVPTVAQAGRLFNYSLLLDCTTADAAIAAGDFTIIGQRIEGYNWAALAQRAVTLSFWVRATKTGTYCAYMTNDVDRSCVKEFTISAADTWEKKTLTFAASPSAGTWDYTTGTGVHVGIALAAGSTSQTTADAWQTGVFFATANQVNGTDNVANDFRITGVQLEPGSVATDFEQRTLNEELALCQRYYETGTQYILQCSPANVAAIGQTVPFATTKRVAPTLTVSASALSGVTGGTVDSASVDQFRGHVATDGVAGGKSATLAWTASAEL